MARAARTEYYLEDPRNGRPGLWQYGPPNKAYAAILVGQRMYNIVADYTLQVGVSFVTRQAAETYRDPGRQHRAGGHRPGQIMQSVDVDVDLDGNDRWVGQVTVGVVYAASEFYGRKKYAQYKGNNNLREALNSVLPHQP